MQYWLHASPRKRSKKAAPYLTTTLVASCLRQALQSEGIQVLVVHQVELPLLPFARNLNGLRPRCAVTDGGVPGRYLASLTRWPGFRAGAIQNKWVCVPGLTSRTREIQTWIHKRYIYIYIHIYMCIYIYI